MSIFISKKIWEFFGKKSADKVWFKKDRVRKVPCLIPIRVKTTLFEIIELRKGTYKHVDLGNITQPRFTLKPKKSLIAHPLMKVPMELAEAWDLTLMILDFRLEW